MRHGSRGCCPARCHAPASDLKRNGDFGPFQNRGLSSREATESDLGRCDGEAGDQPEQNLQLTVQLNRMR